MAESKAWQSKHKLENYKSIEAYLDVVVGKVKYPTIFDSPEAERKVHKIPTVTYNTNEKTTFHYDHETKKCTKVFQCCNIKTLFYSEGETLIDGTEILTFSPNPAIITNLYKYGQYSIARNGQKHLGSVGLSFRRKSKNEDIKRGHMANNAQAHYRNFVVNATTKEGCYILKNEDIQIRDNPKKQPTAQCRQVFPSHRERRKVANSFEPNQYSEKRKEVRREIVRQIQKNRESKKRIDLMIRKPKK